MRERPPLGRELAEAQDRLDEVLARCAIRLSAFSGATTANDNFLFPGKGADESDCARGEGSRDRTG